MNTRPVLLIVCLLQLIDEESELAAEIKPIPGVRYSREPPLRLLLLIPPLSLPSSLSAPPSHAKWKLCVAALESKSHPSLSSF